MRLLRLAVIPLVLLGSTPLHAQEKARRLSTAEAREHIGEQATVCGLVASARYSPSSRGQPTFLNLDRPYPDQLFTVVIWGEDRADFKQPPERAYARKRICVTGTVTSYRGTPQIVVTSPAQIQADGR